MGLTIKTTPEFLLELAADRSVALPSIALVPTSENLPHVKRFEVEVEGRSSPLAHEDEVDQIAAKLALGYPKLEYRPGKEVALRQQMTVPINRVLLDGPVPAGARFALTVQVWYYDSDAQGRPNSGAGVKGPIKSTSVLMHASSSAAVGTAIPVVGPCRIEVEPAQVTLIDRGDTAELTVRVENRPAEVAPRLVLAETFTDAPELGTALSALVTGTLQRSADTEAGRVEAWRVELSLQLEPEARRFLWERSQGGPLEVNARAEVPGKAVGEFVFRLLCQEDVFKGLIALDFGTSNSTVTLYDPGVVED
ncbi:MAG: hypothetical protein L0Z62_50340, partial [Gemmataceae bacterium]|nr:hypothetical protein [Gemmataceae bacterium]